MNSSELEEWAVRMAARNDQRECILSPVILYRNGRAALLGALGMQGDSECIITAAHGFSVDYQPCAWSFRALIPSPAEPRAITRAAPLRNPEDDVAICTPASLLESSIPLPNFYTGWRRGIRPPNDFEVLSVLNRVARCVLTGEDVRLLAEVRFGGSVHILLDYVGSEGISGAVFLEEAQKCMYVLRAYSPSLTRLFGAVPGGNSLISKGVAVAMRLRYA